VSASPIVRRSNPPTPTHPGREYMFHPNAGVPQNSRIMGGPYYEPYTAGSNEQRRFLSESELMYERQYQGPGAMSGAGVQDSSAPIRELASSPQRGVYHWKDNSPTAGPPGSAAFGSLQNYFHSNPASPVQHNPLINSSGNSATSGVSSRPYYHGGSNYVLGKGIPPVSPNMKFSNQGQESFRPSPINRRPVSFVRALEMTDSMEAGNRGQNTRNSPAGTPKGQTAFNESSERASVYDMNYEISV
jgi:palmitoyltransferase